MPLTKTSHQSFFYHPPPEAITFTCPLAAPVNTTTNPPTIINSHVGSELTTQYHWHTTNTEYREAQDAYFLEHGKEEMETLKGEDLIAGESEWTDPADRQKEIFFRNLLSTVLEPQYASNVFWLGELKKTLQVMCVMWKIDNYLVLVDFGGWRGEWRALVEAAFTYIVMGCMISLGRLCGYRTVTEKYTLKHLIKRLESERPKSE
ncbi:MAG: hypothetical protein Q9175_008190 [Cornicularia normoerica]